MPHLHIIEVPWGEVFDPHQIEDAIQLVQPKVVEIVQGDTLATLLQPCRTHFSAPNHISSMVSFGVACSDEATSLSQPLKLPTADYIGANL